jgi:hypothetical protein
MPTTITVSTFDQLQNAITTVNAATSGSYTISFASPALVISETATILEIGLQSGVTLTLDGDGGALNGSSGGQQFGGLAVLSGAVTIQNLIVENTLTSGGNGNGNSGGGAGLGGGLFVGSTAVVTLSSVGFSSDSAAGGNGGPGGYTADSGYGGFATTTGPGFTGVSGGRGGASSLFEPGGVGGTGGLGGTASANAGKGPSEDK